MDIQVAITSTRELLEAHGATHEEFTVLQELALRDPEEVSIAVVGPQNAGKTTLIAALTGDTRALDDIGAVPTTSRSTRYEMRRGSEVVEVWDTPGLGSEFANHDSDARDRAIRADAVVVTLSELISDE